ncbi:fasciclin domain-containing protein, partial [Lentzea albidocapillata]|uniref:fasciclin domain-containing protein n=1 Tax=Lentzea albidocapillata TaxID=40571 RepID=UPI00200C99A9
MDWCVGPRFVTGRQPDPSDRLVFAPVDSAFAKIDAATIEKLKTDDALLTKILT